MQFYAKALIFIGAVNKFDSCLHMKCAGSKTVARTKESHFIGRLVDFARKKHISNFKDLSHY